MDTHIFQKEGGIIFHMQEAICNKEIGSKAQEM